MMKLAHTILRHVLAMVRACFDEQPEPFPKNAYTDFMSRLCFVDGSNLSELSDEWIRLLGAVIMQLQPRE